MRTVAGTWTLLRTAVRRDLLFWICWIVVLAAMPPSTAVKYDQLVPAGTDPHTALAPLASNPSLVALLGPAFNPWTKGGFTFWRVGGFTAMFAGMMAGFAIIRATRAEEEDGRLELIRAGAVGRHAPLMSALVESALGCLVAGLVTALVCIGDGLGVRGSLAGGLAVTVCGLVVAGPGAAIAQVFASARTARGWTLGVLFGGMFLLRMTTDAAGDADAALRWAVPLEWGILIRPWAGERWWVAALAVALFLVTSALALRLESIRDHGAGLRTARPGPASAAGYLSGPFGLSWRLQRNGIIGWAAGLLIGAIGSGSIISQTGSSLANNRQLTSYLDHMGGSDNFLISFFATMLVILFGIAAIMVITVLGHLRTEESRGRIEPILAGATTRARVSGSHLTWAVLAPVVVMVAAGGLLALPRARSNSDWSLPGQYAASALALAPGLLLVCGIALLLVGWAPRLYGLAWAVIGWTLFTTWFSAIIDMPGWMVRLQPWGHLSLPPRDPMHWTPFLVETGIAIVLLGLGMIGYRRRNIPA